MSCKALCRPLSPERRTTGKLVTKDIENAAYRVERLKRLKGINLYAQAERNDRKGIVPNALQKEFAQRFVYGRCYLVYFRRQGLIDRNIRVACPAADCRRRQIRVFRREIKDFA